jgi:hypothetical protein
MEKNIVTYELHQCYLLVVVTHTKCCRKSDYDQIGMVGVGCMDQILTGSSKILLKGMIGNIGGSFNFQK